LPIKTEFGLPEIPGELLGENKDMLEFNGLKELDTVESTLLPLILND